MVKSKGKTRSGRAGYPAYLKTRVKKLQSRVRDWAADALLVSNPNDIRYLTGFVGDDSWAVVRANSTVVHIISDFRFEEQIQREAPHAKAIMRKAGLAEELGKLASKIELKRMALQQDHVTLATRKQLAKHLGAKRLTIVEDGLLEQRAVKDEAEVKAIRRSIRIQQQAFLNTLEYIEPGQTEQQVAGYLEYQMRLLGAEGASFASIVAVDGNAALPHAIPGNKKIRRGGIILIDWGARAGGYCSDMTRVVALGKMSAKMREIYQVTLDAQLAAIDAVKPGVRLKDVDAVARGIINKAGYGKHFGHGLGHGIGLDIHEQPVLSWRSEGQLVPGQIVTVEPGIYLPGQGGVRIEDDVLVTEKGRRVLCDLPKCLDSAII